MSLNTTIGKQLSEKAAFHRWKWMIEVDPPKNDKGYALNLWSDIPGWKASKSKANAKKVRFVEIK